MEKMTVCDILFFFFPEFLLFQKVIIISTKDPAFSPLQCVASSSALSRSPSFLKLCVLLVQVSSSFRTHFPTCLCVHLVAAVAAPQHVEYLSLSKLAEESFLFTAKVCGKRRKRLKKREREREREREVTERH